MIRCANKTTFSLSTFKQPERGTQYDIRRRTVSQCVNEDVALGGSGSVASTTEVAEKFRIAARNL